ncbi:TetR/AcrR family transcriptional regulator [Halobacillus salinarum]|uniref:TetR/AcrR family transcriptional regulator n=1 Tax=Halobacillus salinarum TaxID=2932257 RepID=A0ABY4ENN7_9BACI|nr:TetR/AcrR family transcriptional regulator [Halobacillus salinarum]UOQ45763.1 TetR/AcrR family transcriptional regulator [Halobacillus salinarum]
MAVDRRVHKSKDALKAALLQLMKASDFSKITITEIVQHADLNRGTFYKHYHTKEELLEEMIDDVLEDLVRSYRAPYVHADKFVMEELTSSKVKIFEHVYSYADFYRSIVTANVIPGFQNKICEVLKKLNREDLVLIDSANDINGDFLTSYYSYALFGLILEWIHSDFKYTPAYMAEQLIQILSYHPDKAVQVVSMADAENVD